MAGLKGHQAAPFIDKANPEDAPVYLENFGIPDQIAMHSSREACRKCWMPRPRPAPSSRRTALVIKELGFGSPHRIPPGCVLTGWGGERIGNQIDGAAERVFFLSAVRKHGG